MMIPILTDYYSPGYLPDSDSKTIPPYLPNASLAIRCKLLKELGGYMKPVTPERMQIYARAPPGQDGLNISSLGR